MQLIIDKNIQNRYYLKYQLLRRVNLKNNCINQFSKESITKQDITFNTINTSIYLIFIKGKIYKQSHKKEHLLSQKKRIKIYQQKWWQYQFNKFLNRTRSYTFAKQQNQNVQMLELCALDIETYDYQETFTLSHQDHRSQIQKVSQPEYFFSNDGAIISTYSLIGKRDINLDKFAYQFDNVFELLAIYDGHGNSTVSHYLETYLLKTLKSHHLLLVDFETAVNETFQLIDKQLHEITVDCPPNTGSTALIILITATQIHLANLGDSRVLSINRLGEVIQLNTEHNLANELQRKEVVNRGGILMRRGKQYRLAGQINVSRSFGDFKYKPIISSVPQVRRISKQDIKYLILGTDGFWSQTSNEKVGDKISKQSCINAQSLMQSLCKRPSDNSTILCYQLP